MEGTQFQNGQAELDMQGLFGPIRARPLAA